MASFPDFFFQRELSGQSQQSCLYYTIARPQFLAEFPSKRHCRFVAGIKATRRINNAIPNIGISIPQTVGKFDLYGFQQIGILIQPFGDVFIVYPAALPARMLTKERQLHFKAVEDLREARILSASVLGSRRLHALLQIFHQQN